MHAQGIVVDGAPKNTASKFYRVTREASPERDERVRALHERFVHRTRLRAAWNAQECRDIRAAESLRLWEECGCIHLTEYLMRTCGLTGREARERIRVAHALGDLPRLEDELEAGRLAFSSVRELVRVVIADKQDEWIEHCSDMTSEQVARAVSGHKRGDSPDDPVDPDEHRHTVSFSLRDSTRARFNAAVRALRRMRGHDFEDDDDLFQTITDVLEAHPGVMTSNAAAQGDDAGVDDARPDDREGDRVANDNERDEREIMRGETTPQGHTEQTTPQGHTEQTTPQGHTEQTTPQGHTEQTNPQGHGELTTPQGHAEPTTPQGHAEPTTPPGPTTNAKPAAGRGKRKRRDEIVSADTLKAMRKALARPPVHVWLMSDGRGFAHGVELPRHELETLLCDSVNMGDIDSPDAGVRKYLSDRERARTLVLFGNKCAVPGCDCETDLDIHHPKHLENGGRDVPANRVPLCKGHHRLHHAGKLIITGVAPYNLVFQFVTPVVAELDAE